MIRTHLMNPHEPRSNLQERRHGLESFLASCPANEDGAVGVDIRLQPHLGHVNLRGDPDNADFIAAARSALEQELPVTPNTMGTGTHHIYWLGPNEWLVVCNISDRPDLMAGLRESLSGLHASVTDVTGGQIAIQLSGPGVRDVLAKGCTLDFHPDTFKAGSCAQSGLAKANVLISLVDDHPTFEIVVRRSLAEYLALWLRQAAGEYRVRFSLG